MIGNETVGPHVDSGLVRLLRQQIPIGLLVAVLKKDRLSTGQPRAKSRRDDRE
jgi:hypothetical protein